MAKDENRTMGASGGALSMEKAAQTVEAIWSCLDTDLRTPQLLCPSPMKNVAAKRTRSREKKLG